MSRQTSIGVVVVAGVILAAMYAAMWIYQSGLDEGMRIMGQPSPGIKLSGADIAEVKGCDITVKPAVSQ